jgi:hypothetical protein
MEAQAEHKTPIGVVTVARAVLMVAPNTFAFDVETAETNAFQHKARATAPAVTARAMAEYTAVRQALKDFGVDVVAYAHERGTYRPNAVFPNNWMTTWPDGKVFIYPMAHASRRTERMSAVIDEIGRRYRVATVRDLSGYERTGHYLEGTGAIVFDHRNKIGYACRSPRCDASLFVEHMREIDYEPVLYDAQGPDGSAVYHTNVMMGIQQSTAVICLAAIRDPTERKLVRETLERSGHEVIDITFEQLNAYCGNLIQLRNSDGRTGLLISRSAHDSFQTRQLDILKRDSELIVVPVPTIQEVGGGSVRCMVAEIFLPERA